MNFNSGNKNLLVIAGPTGAGKTELAISIAEYFGAEIISADSRQVYSEMKIGTARPEPEELKGVPYHFTGNISISQEYNVGLYEREVISFLKAYYKKKDIAILCGGTGLYIEAVLNGIDNFPDSDTQIQDEIRYKFEKVGLIYLQDELKRVDPVYFSRVDIYNPHRLIRALTVTKQTGKPYSYFLNKTNVNRDFQAFNLLTELPRNVLYNKINDRVDRMVERGLETEARALYEHRNCKALQTVGYKELFSYFDGLISKEGAIELIKRNSRRYAKRQLTWFNNRGEWIKIDPRDIDSVINLIINKINQIEKRYS